ncbi:Uncharacterised protein [Salmonella enterica subsp. enterica serovar Bovismorbificans]|uniref:Uncharacterized protein n=1 Tax=Salmonella enterica subsp. enterica serovar Bovismorbificans TaxID=58097 RepID=A0A655EF12_SALET|nr:Uncharacterised protein [Salmonella enterica subsp. enterica serovar Bovismorbificans]
MAGVAKAAAGTFVAGRPDRVCQHQQCIVVAIRRNADDIQHMA